MQPLACFYSCDRKFLSHKTLREDRTAAVRKYVAEATRRRRRILRAGFFLKNLLVKDKSMETKEKRVE
mgnify:CR=1 FL=1